jgi:hypothetical protein
MHLRRGVIILGAGASKGARVTGKRTPPLDGDFLDTAAEYFSRKRARGKGRAQVKVWNDFGRRLRSAHLDFSEIRHWRLEQLSTFLEARANLTGMQLNQGRPREHANALEALKVVVCHVLQVQGGTYSCDLHKALFRLVAPRAVLSFNYDIIADQSLAELGLLNWRSAQYRCARVAAVPTSNTRTKTKYVALHAKRNAGGIPLLKLHGSMHYEELLRGPGFRLSGVALPNAQTAGFNYLRVPSRPFLIPPIASKIGIAQLALRERWYAALDHLHDAPLWILWGYSFPITDTISQVLFRTALSNNRKSKPVIVINPDASVVARVREVCRKVNIEYYPSMERFLMDNKGIEYRPVV